MVIWAATAGMATSNATARATDAIGKLRQEGKDAFMGLGFLRRWKVIRRVSSG
jgi:hypothetical protein